MFSVLLVSCKNQSKGEPVTVITAELSTPQTTQYASESTTEYQLLAQPESSVSITEAHSETVTQKQPTTTVPVTAKTEKTTQKQQSITETTTEKYQKTGESLFTEDRNNKYLKAVAEKYGLDYNNAVCIYTVPDANGNVVLEFDGSVDKNNRYIRNNDTLIAIYTIDKNMNSKRASENESLNEYEYVEMKTMFFSTKKWLIPKFENELNNAPVKK